jgi:hypothetical protein
MLLGFIDMNFPSVDPDPNRFPEKVIDPKDHTIEILQAHIKDLQGIIEYLKSELARKPVSISKFESPRPKLNTAGEIRQALEKMSREQKIKLEEVERAAKENQANETK